MVSVSMETTVASASILHIQLENEMVCLTQSPDSINIHIQHNSSDTKVATVAMQFN